MYVPVLLQPFSHEKVLSACCSCACMIIKAQGKFSFPPRANLGHDYKNCLFMPYELGMIVYTVLYSGEALARFLIW